MNDKKIHVIGAASGIAAPHTGTGDGPIVLKKSAYIADLKNHGIELIWDAIIQPEKNDDISILEKVTHFNTELATKVAALVKQEKFFTVFGGDHSCAIGTWSGVVSEKSKKGDVGLLWIDAHMDSHTPNTSPTGNIHGMPLACLLGEGDPDLTGILSAAPKLKPENVCLVGVRSFEPGEAELLQRLGVRIYFMDEVKRKGLKAIMEEAYRIITLDTIGFGITIDIDSIDPSEAPATGVSEPDGLSATELYAALTRFANKPNFIGMEIVEFDPHLDKNQITEKLIANLITSLTINS